MGIGSWLLLGKANLSLTPLDTAAAQAPLDPLGLPPRRPAVVRVKSRQGASEQHRGAGEPSRWDASPSTRGQDAGP